MSLPLESQYLAVLQQWAQRLISNTILIHQSKCYWIEKYILKRCYLLNSTIFSVISSLIFQWYPLCAFSHQSLEDTVDLSQKENNKTLEILYGIQILEHFAIVPSYYLALFRIYPGGQFALVIGVTTYGWLVLPVFFFLLFHSNSWKARFNLVLIFCICINTIRNVTSTFLFNDLQWLYKGISHLI